MLYDEEGKAYVEPPLIPEEQHVFNIVKDYQRMFREYGKIANRNEKLRKSNEALGKANNWLNSEVKEYRDVIRHCVNYMKRCGVEPSTFLTDWLTRKNIK